MFPRSITCEDCGEIAAVRGYGQIEYDWPETTTSGSEPTTPIINRIRLTIDCPLCGVKTQEFFPNGRPKPAADSAATVAGRYGGVPFRRLGSTNRNAS